MRKRRGPLVGARDADHTNEGARAEPHPLNELHGGVCKGFLRLGLQLMCDKGAAAKPQHFAISIDDAHILHVAQPGEKTARKMGAIASLLRPALTDHHREDWLVANRRGI